MDQEWKAQRNCPSLDSVAARVFASIVTQLGHASVPASCCRRENACTNGDPACWQVCWREFQPHVMPLVKQALDIRLAELDAAEGEEVPSDR